MMKKTKRRPRLDLRLRQAIMVDEKTVTDRATAMLRMIEQRVRSSVYDAELRATFRMLGRWAAEGADPKVSRSAKQLLAALKRAGVV